MYQSNSSASADTTTYADALLAVALVFAERGYYVFPVLLTQDPDDPYRKKYDPLVKWNTESTRDPEVIRGWFGKGGQFRGTGLAVDCGRSGIAVADLDVKPGKDGCARWGELVAQHGEEGNPLRATTWTGGKHRIYRARPEASIGNTSRGEVAHGIDTRDVGGCIFVAPTIVMESGGKSYQFDGLASIEDLPRVEDLPLVPAWLPPLTKKKPAKPTATRTATVVPRQRPASRATGWGRVEESQYLHSTLQDCPDTPPGLLRYLEHKAREIEDLPMGGAANQPCNDAAFEFSSFIAAGEVPEEVVRARLEAAVDTWTNGKSKGYTAIDLGLRDVDTAEPRYWEERAQEEAVTKQLREMFWEARPVLRHLRDAAYARRGGRWAVLAAALAHAISQVPPTFVIPPVRASRASLNFYTVVVAPKGVGKSSALTIARNALDFVGCQRVYSRELGSGQGISAMYYQPRKVGKATEMVRVRDAAIAEIGEIRSLEGHAQMSGSILIPTLLKAAMGETIGPQYKSSALDIDVPEHSYRFVILATSQTKNSGILLRDSESGLPQRFLWATATKNVIENRPEWPGSYPLVLHPEIMAARGEHEPSPLDMPGEWEPPSYGEAEVREIVLPDVAVRDIEAADDAESHGEYEEPEESRAAHSLLIKAKTAVALAILDGRIDVTEEDWELAEIVMGESRSMQDLALRTVSNEKINAAIGKARVELAAQDAIEDEKLQKMVDDIRRRVTSEWQPKGKIRTAANSRLRGEFFEDAFSWLVEAEEIEVEPQTRRGRTSDYVRLKP